MSHSDDLLKIAQALTSAYHERAAFLVEIHDLEAALASRKLELLNGVNFKALGSNADAREVASGALLVQDHDYDEMQGLLLVRRGDLAAMEAEIAGLERQFEAHKAAIRELQIKALWPDLVADEALGEQAEELIGTYAAEVMDDNESLAMPF